MTYTNGAQCTSDFVFTDGTDVFLGQAAHCAGTGSSSETDGCTSASLPLGTPVEVVGASRPGTLVYSSWLSMQAAGEKDPDTCTYNDFALVRLDPADVSRTNPSLPHYGGPVGMDPDGTQPGETVFGYGNSKLRAGIEALRPKTGTSLGTSGGGRTHTVASLPPGIPGDSGSAYVSADGSALGLLSTLNIAPQAGTNGVSDLRSALDYANDSGDLDNDVELVPGDQPFTPNPVPVDLG
ncbi:MAG: serine protease [Actinomycetota bacterium]|nr:serine protease [Actinomycetota bacterium]